MTAAANAGGATRLGGSRARRAHSVFVDHRAIEWPEGPETGARDVIAPGYEQATTAVDVVIELGSDDRITAEWIRYGSLARECSGPSPGPVTVAGGSGPVTAGQHVEVGLGSPRERPSMRRCVWALGHMDRGSVGRVPAPTTPGRACGGSGGPARSATVDYVSGDGSSETPPSEPDDPWTGIYVISAIEVSPVGSPASRRALPGRDTDVSGVLYPSNGAMRSESRSTEGTPSMLESVSAAIPSRGVAGAVVYSESEVSPEPPAAS